MMMARRGGVRGAVSLLAVLAVTAGRGHAAGARAGLAEVTCSASTCPRGNCTALLQRALDSHVTVVVGSAAGYMCDTAPLFLRSHQVCVIRSNATIRALDGPDYSAARPHASVLNVASVENVTLTGGGTVVGSRPWPPTRPREPPTGAAPAVDQSHHSHTAADQTHQMALSITNSTRVWVSNISLARARGDGVYIAGVVGKGSRVPSPHCGSKSVHFADVVVANNSRNGLSVIACVDCSFTRCVFQGMDVCYRWNPPACPPPSSAPALLCNGGMGRPCVLCRMRCSRPHIPNPNMFASLLRYGGERADGWCGSGAQQQR